MFDINAQVILVQEGEVSRPLFIGNFEDVCNFMAAEYQANNYEKIVLSMDRNYINSYDGIKSLNLIDWLLGK